MVFHIFHELKKSLPMKNRNIKLQSVIVFVILVVVAACQGSEKGEGKSPFFQIEDKKYEVELGL